VYSPGGGGLTCGGVLWSPGQHTTRASRSARVTRTARRNTRHRLRRDEHLAGDGRWAATRAATLPSTPILTPTTG